MAKERALTLEALRVMDAIDRRGSFAAAADELGRVPSALSYTMQKLEEELDVVLFDRSGHRTKFTNVGRMLLERGRVLLEAADKLTTDAEALSRGWETHLTIVTEALVPTPDLFPLIENWRPNLIRSYRLSPRCWPAPGSGWSRGGRISLSRRICIFVPPRRLTRANSIRCSMCTSRRRITQSTRAGTALGSDPREIPRRRGGGYRARAARPHRPVVG